MATSKTTTYSWLILLIVIVGSIAFLLGVCSPEWNAIKTSKQEKQIALGQLEQKKNTLKIIETVRKEYDENFAKVQRLEAAIPEEEDIPGLIIQARDLAFQSGIGVESASFGKAQAVVQNAAATNVVPEAFSGESDLSSSQPITMGTLVLKAVPIQLSAEGSYDNLKRFLDVVGSNLRLLEVGSIAVSGAEGGNFRMALLMKAYVLGK